MGTAILHLLLFSLMLLQSPTSAAAAATKSYVVYLGAHSHPPAELLTESSADELYGKVTESHCEFLSSFIGRDEASDAIFYSYTRHINGFAATIDDDVAADIARHPSVVSVFENRGKRLHTTRSWEFLGLEHDDAVPSDSVWKKASLGKDTIIGNLDTGVWPESKSFMDDGGYGPVPSKWRGICQNDHDPAFHCNRKLIGARYFNKGYAAAVGTLNATFYSPRDNEGHGSHTLSTAGGNFVPGASVLGYGNGTAKGGSPRARVAAYKVCWPPSAGNECFDADILAAFDAAIHDGVDLLSVSLGGDPTPYFNDSIAIGSFHAIKHGIVVVCSAGNSGPSDGSVSNLSPWLITVAASTMDRDFSNYVITGDGKRFKGASMSQKSLPSKFYELISAANARAQNASADQAILCEAGTLDPVKVKGKILLCLRGDNARVDKGEQALLAGAVGMILANNMASGNEILPDPHLLPASHIKYSQGVAVFRYVNSTKSPMAQITRVTTQIDVKPAPIMAAFSSKGPNTLTPEIFKPDITAPGVSVIAAYTEAQGPTNLGFDKRRIPFNAVSGTSMSCPHISGVVGLLKTLHPSWSPAAIRSAIMTTATPLDNSIEVIRAASFVKATPFSYGAGLVRPNNAMDPGLVYDLGVNDYLNFLCTLGYNETQISRFSSEPYKCPESINLLDFNYPAITIPKLKGSVTVTRILKNVGPPGTYTPHIVSPNGVSVSVKPSKLSFHEIGEERPFKVTFKVRKAFASKDYLFGELLWSDKTHSVRSPIVVKM
ncbi:hypothetical protein SAY86_029764 [Trapa natans]|uniref:Subtilisin-like protease SBT5.3 n=1 Tax=Trapa natans TaxID=22666 RepID=A0AAN7MNU2_TRANT|nr:hypothetical protein SAY86_029764 [Trapa natans]